MDIKLNVYGALAMAIALTASIGCGGEAPTAEEEATAEVDVGNTGQTQQALGNPGDVGIITNATFCPAGVHLGQAYMDTEDDAGITTTTGWHGSWTTGPSTGVLMRVCRVPGALFKPVTTNPNAVDKFYAVLQMGETCPAQSVPFTRTFDNEDNNNKNRVDQEIDPTTVVNSSTAMRFCLFRNATTTSGTMPDFPFLFSGMEYGIFAKPTAPPFVIDSGAVITDDEDDANNNSLTALSTNIVAQAATIIEPGPNTRLNMTRVW